MRRQVIETLKETYGNVIDYEKFSNEDLIMYMLLKIIKDERY